MAEVWKPVVEYEESYAISDAGRVLNIRTGKILRGRSIKNYLWVALQVDGKRQDRAIHLLVLEAFVSLCPEGKEAFHVNDVEWDNRLENLRWDTRSANIKHSRRPGRLTQRERIELIKQGY